MTAPQQEAEAVKAWMESLGFKIEGDLFWKEPIQAIDFRTATFFYKASKQAELEAQASLERLLALPNIEVPEGSHVRAVYRSAIEAELHRLQKGDV